MRPLKSFLWLFVTLAASNAQQCVSSLGIDTSIPEDMAGTPEAAPIMQRLSDGSHFVLTPSTFGEAASHVGHTPVQLPTRTPTIGSIELPRWDYTSEQARLFSAAAAGPRSSPWAMGAANPTSQDQANQQARPSKRLARWIFIGAGAAMAAGGGYLWATSGQWSKTRIFSPILDQEQRTTGQAMVGIGAGFVAIGFFIH